MRWLVATGIACTLIPTVALGGWGPDGATIKATTNPIHQVDATTDWAGGAIVAFDEAGILRAIRIMPTGDPDPQWPMEGAVVCSVNTARAAVGIEPDGHGGGFIWWMEGRSLFLSRVTPGGMVADGWPARGRLLGTLDDVAQRPDAAADPIDGIYLVWTEGLEIQLVAIGCGNSGLSSWPNEPVVVGTAAWGGWPQVSVGPEGDVFIAWWRPLSPIPFGDSSEFKVLKYSSDGIPAPEWPGGGVSVETVFLQDGYDSPRLDLTADDEGVALLALLGRDELDPRVFRFDASGSVRSGWPTDGVAIPIYISDFHFGPEIGFRVFPGVGDDVLVLCPAFSVHWPSQHAASVAAAGVTSQYMGVNVADTKAVSDGRGGLFVATMKPSGAYGPYVPDAFIDVGYFKCPPGWQGFGEHPGEHLYRWYGDTGLAGTGDGSVIFVWSQERERFGLFARRLSGGGDVLGVAPPVSSGRLTATFTTGVGVRLAGRVDGASRLELFDLAGRRVSAVRVAAGPFDVVLPATERLAAGLYFSRVAGETSEARARVLVLP